MNKKGELDIQFNWIYVAVVGAIVLLIFVSIAFNIRKGANERLAVDAMDYFEEIFTSLHKSENTETTIDLPGIDLNVEGNKYACDYYTLGDSGLQGRSIKYIPFFSPDNVKKKIVSYALSWNVPFRVNYFLYITSPDIAYVFVDGAMPDMVDSLPKNVLFKEEATTSSFINNNHYKVKYILEDQPPGSIHQSLLRLDDKDVSAVNFVDEKVEFYQKNGNTLQKVGESFTMDDETKLAAFYSENIEHYECNLLKGINRIDRLSSVLMERIDILMNSGQLKSECNGYGEAKSKLNDIRTAAAVMIQANEITQNGMTTLKQSKLELKDLNTELNTKACPTVY